MRAVIGTQMSKHLKRQNSIRVEERLIHHLLKSITRLLSITTISEHIYNVSSERTRSKSNITRLGLCVQGKCVLSCQVATSVAHWRSVRRRGTSWNGSIRGHIRCRARIMTNGGHKLGELFHFFAPQIQTQK